MLFLLGNVTLDAVPPHLRLLKSNTEEEYQHNNRSFNFATVLQIHSRVSVKNRFIVNRYFGII